MAKFVEFIIPDKGEPPVCQECKNCFPDIYRECVKPCSHFVSWVCHEVGKITRDIITNMNWG